jgi:hypothetical protein
VTVRRGREIVFLISSRSADEGRVSLRPSISVIVSVLDGMAMVEGDEPRRTP